MYQKTSLNVLPVHKRQRSVTKSGRAHLVSFALTSSANLADVEAKEAKRSKEKAVPKRCHSQSRQRYLQGVIPNRPRSHRTK